MNDLEVAEKSEQLSVLINRRNKAKTKRIRKKLDKEIHIIVALFKTRAMKDNDFAGYSVMLRGGIKKLTWKQELEILDVALLSNDYEHLKYFIK